MLQMIFLFFCLFTGCMVSWKNSDQLQLVSFMLRYAIRYHDQTTDCSVNTRNSDDTAWCIWVIFVVPWPCLMLVCLTEPTSARPQLDTNSSAQVSKSREGERRGEESRALTVSSSRSDRTEARVSSSASDNQSRYFRLFSGCTPGSCQIHKLWLEFITSKLIMQNLPYFCLLMLLLLLQLLLLLCLSGSTKICLSV